MDNQEFLKVVSRSFKMFLDTGSRSNEKLKILHGAIAQDLQNRLGSEYKVCSLGIGDGREENISGRYIDKKVDITILKNKKAVAGIGVKFVMQNYSQNSNNYFENMLGETANIRCANTPYFQIFIIPDKLPYYDKEGNLKKWETFSEHNSKKYLMLSKDNIETSIHTPNKTLLFVISLPDTTNYVVDRNSYNQYYNRYRGFIIDETPMQYGSFSPAVIYNDYVTFAKKVVYTILAI